MKTGSQSIAKEKFANCSWRVAYCQSYLIELFTNYQDAIKLFANQKQVTKMQPITRQENSEWVSGINPVMGRHSPRLIIESDYHDLSFVTKSAFYL